MLWPRLAPRARFLDTLAMIAGSRSVGHDVAKLLLPLVAVACGSRSGMLDGGESSTGGAAGSGGAGGIAASLSGLRWELPCRAPRGGGVCTTNDNLGQYTVLSGDPNTIYDVKLRIRGVLEEKTYVGGTPLGAFQLGGQPAIDDWNTYGLGVSDPPQNLFLNPGVSGQYFCTSVDDVVTLPMRGGASVLLAAVVYDSQQIENVSSTGSPIVVPGVAPYPSAYDGQFAQVDVLGATEPPP